MNPPKIRLGSSRLQLPRSRAVRLALGIMLILGGLLGFLPVLGFWMIPLGFIVLSVDLPAVRRWRRRVSIWRAWGKDAKKRDRGKPAADDRDNL